MKYKQYQASILIQVYYHKYGTDYILEDFQRDCHLKKETAMCDSFQIDSIEKPSLHTYFNNFYEKQASRTCDFFSEDIISRIFTRISSKENIQSNFQLKLCNSQCISARNISQGNVACFFLKIEDVESLLEVNVASKS